MSLKDHGDLDLLFQQYYSSTEPKDRVKKKKVTRTKSNKNKTYKRVLNTTYEMKWLIGILL